MSRSKTWILASIAILGVAAIVILLVTFQSSNSKGNTESGEGAAVEEQMGEQTGNGQAGTSQEQAGGQDITTVPGGGGNTPSSLVVKFPDPVNNGGGGAPGDTTPGENPPPGEQGNIYGQWVINMTGTTYSLENLHINLETAGTITSPDDYKKVFEISQSQFRWESGKSDFSATIQAVLKLGSSQNQTVIPIKIELTGQVSDSLTEIKGTFIATPQVDAYSTYAQQGTFAMHR